MQNSAESFEKVTHCLFDMDGLLLNTEHIYTKITQQILDEQGCNEKFTGDVKVRLMGGQTNEVANAIVKRYNLSMTVDEYVARQRELALNLMPTAEILPGVEKLLHHLSSHNVPIALATSSSKAMYDLKTIRHTKLFELFHHKVYGSSDPEVMHGKPAPDIFIVAASRFPDKPNPRKCLVFEDAPNGVKAAIAANCQVVLVPEDYVPIEMRKEATHFVNTLDDFKPELFGLPPLDN